MKRIPFPVIEAAKRYDVEAIDFIRRHFEGYIASCCMNSYTDQYGNAKAFVDDDLRCQAETALLSAIFSFRFKEPPDDFFIN